MLWDNKLSVASWLYLYTNFTFDFLTKMKCILDAICIRKNQKNIYQTK